MNNIVGAYGVRPNVIKEEETMIKIINKTKTLIILSIFLATIAIITIFTKNNYKTENLGNNNVIKQAHDIRRIYFKYELIQCHIRSNNKK